MTNKHEFELPMQAKVSVRVGGEIVARTQGVDGDSYLVEYESDNRRPVRRWHPAHELEAQQ